MIYVYMIVFELEIELFVALFMYVWESIYTNILVKKIIHYIYGCQISQPFYFLSLVKVIPLTPDFENMAFLYRHIVI